MRKLMLEIEITDDTEKVFLDHGVKEEDYDKYLRLLFGQAIQQIINSIPEMLIALKSGVASEQEVFEKMYQKGENLGSEVHRKYMEQKKESSEKHV